MASKLTLPLLALFPKVFSLRSACGTAVKSVRISISVSEVVKCERSLIVESMERQGGRTEG